MTNAEDEQVNTNNAAQRFLEEYDEQLYGELDPNFPRVIEIHLDDVRPNPNQPRKTFDEEKLQELAQSIREVGLIQPITVAEDPETDSKFIVVAGERRYRAHLLIPEKETILAIRTTGNPDEIALIENVQREDLDPFEEAEGYHALMKKHKYKQQDLSRIVGKKQNTISEILSLRRVPVDIRKDYRSTEFQTRSRQVLIEIAREKDKGRQLSLWESAKNQKLSLRQVRDLKKKPVAADDASDRAARLLSELRRTIKRIEKKVFADDFPEGSSQRTELQDLKKEFSRMIDTILSRNEAGWTN